MDDVFKKYRAALAKLDDIALLELCQKLRMQLSGFDAAYAWAREHDGELPEEVVAASERRRAALDLAERALKKVYERGTYGSCPMDWPEDVEDAEDGGSGI